MSSWHETAGERCVPERGTGWGPSSHVVTEGAVKTGAATADHRCVKTNDLAVAAGHSVDPARWQEAFEVLMGRIAGRFARVEPRRRVRDLVLGLLSDLPRKNCWSIAEWAGDASPDGMQHLLGRAKWDADRVRDDVREYVLEHLHDEDAVLVVDETGDVPRLTASAPSRRNAATNLPKQRGLSPVNGAMQDGSGAVITTATARHHRKAVRFALHKMGARDCTLRTAMPAQAAMPASGWSAGPSSRPPSRTNSEPVAKDASWEVMKSNRRVMSEGSARRGMAKGSGE